MYGRFRGDNCEENVDDCPGNLCQNGATCLDDVNRYRCLCPPTYSGELCEKDIDECSLRPSVCHNGATCTNTPGGYSCICVNGWTGKDCSENIDDCQGAACFNGATCIDRVGSFYCQCTPGKTGTHTHLKSLLLGRDRAHLPFVSIIKNDNFPITTLNAAPFFADEVLRKRDVEYSFKRQSVTAVCIQSGSLNGTAPEDGNKDRSTNLTGYLSAPAASSAPVLSPLHDPNAAFWRVPYNKPANGIIKGPRAV
ncbi:unnamed protein product [Nezara viridula]|uniref:EGF-like domain-containing protein n=1 Tax=Nezara viridula TaxID=85310 RepID=A0A9P0MQP1_NEZVI|nr:unnamed protein product [Nezara viridula]